MPLADQRTGHSPVCVSLSEAASSPHTCGRGSVTVLTEFQPREASFSVASLRVEKSELRTGNAELEPRWMRTRACSGVSPGTLRMCLIVPCWSSFRSRPGAKDATLGVLWGILCVPYPRQWLPLLTAPLTSLQVSSKDSCGS